MATTELAMPWKNLVMANSDLVEANSKPGTLKTRYGMANILQNFSFTGLNMAITRANLTFIFGEQALT